MKKNYAIILTCLFLTSCYKDYSKEVIIEAKQMFPKGKIYKERYGVIIVDSSGLYKAQNLTSLAQNKLNVIITKYKEIK